MKPSLGRKNHWDTLYGDKIPLRLHLKTEFLAGCYMSQELSFIDQFDFVTGNSAGGNLPWTSDISILH